MSKHQPTVSKVLADATDVGLGFGGVNRQPNLNIRSKVDSEFNAFIQTSLACIERVKPFDCSLQAVEAENSSKEALLDIDAILKSIEGIQPFDVSSELTSVFE